MTKAEIIKVIESRGGKADPSARKGALEALLAELPGHRVLSAIERPVDAVWTICDEMAYDARANGEPLPKRKLVIQYLQEFGIAYYTARTQYQAWFTHTARGTNLIADGNPRPTKRNRK